MEKVMDEAASRLISRLEELRGRIDRMRNFLEEGRLSQREPFIVPKVIYILPNIERTFREMRTPGTVMSKMTAGEMVSTAEIWSERIQDVIYYNQGRFKNKVLHRHLTSLLNIVSFIHGAVQLHLPSSSDEAS